MISQLFWASRPISWINTAYPFAFTYWLITQSISIEMVLGTFFFLIPYNLLMYGINDVFDYESDLRNPRKGSIEGALLAPKFHRATLLISFLTPLPFFIYLLTVGPWSAKVILILTVFSVVAYSVPKLRFKERPFLDSFTSALHFVGPLAYAFALANVSLLDGIALPVLITFMLWGMASHAFGAVQDVMADRMGGVASIATQIGAKNTVRFALVCYLIAIAMIFTIPNANTLMALAFVPYLIVVAPFLNISDEGCADANRGWRKFIWLNYFAGAVITLLVL